MRRRELLIGSLSGVALVSLSRHARAEAENPRELRIGYQKNGVLVIARQQAVLQQQLAQRGVELKWVEFTSGPPLLEAMNVGSIDLGQVGDTPPIFAQAAGAAVVYVAGQPITNGQGILVRPDSDIRTLADLKGKRIGFTKGSSAHIGGALLVAPADVDGDDRIPREVRDFAPMPPARLPFRGAAVVASTNDPYMGLERARTLAQAWGTRFVNAGACGHINIAAGFGPWPAGEALLADLMRGTGATASKSLRWRSPDMRAS
jgi:ABC-type nitrate/sulfonate/bicarbonate transport system substrate-binding protein